MATTTKREKVLELLLDSILGAGEYNERDTAVRSFYAFVSALNDEEKEKEVPQDAITKG